MARGRMIDQAITKDKKVHQLSCDTSRLAYTWLITFADVEGRTYGDPALVRSMLFPRCEEITGEQVESYIREWDDSGLVIWYEANGDKWIYFPAFEKHNLVNRAREAPSIIPAPTQEQLMSRSRVGHDQLTVKLIKDNVIEEEAETTSTATTLVTIPAINQTGNYAVAERIYRGITGHMTIPTGKRDDATTVILRYYQRIGSEAEAIEALKPYFREWKKREYSPTNMAWLTDWAATENIPEKKEEPHIMTDIEREQAEIALYAKRIPK